MFRNKQDIDAHFEHNARDIVSEIIDPDTAEAVDITGASAEWVLKEEHGADDSAALLTKTGDQGGVETDVSFDTTNNIVTVHIASGETELAGTDWSAGDLTKSWYHRLDVTDSTGDVVSVHEGDFEIIKR